MLGRLIPCGGGIPLELVGPRVTIGRIDACDVALAHPTVSSRHCQLELRDGVWHVTDLNSRNGVRIDGQRVGNGPLPPGSILSVAQLRFQVEYALAAPAKLERPRGPAAESKPPKPASTSELTPIDTEGHKYGSLKGEAFGELLPCGGGSPIPLVQEKLIIGRSSSCDITLPFATVSSRHCELEFLNGFWHVRDLGSRNGIRVQSTCVLARYIRPGEVLSIAKLRFEVNYVAAGDEPPPDERPFALSLLESAGLSRRGENPQLPELPEESRDDKLHKKWTLE